jgi:hypothetical protein
MPLANVSAALADFGGGVLVPCAPTALVVVAGLWPSPAHFRFQLVAYGLLPATVLVAGTVGR